MAWFSNHRRYSTAFLELQKESAKPEKERGWKLLQSGRNAGKGKGKELISEELQKEIQWLKSKLEKDSHQVELLAWEAKTAEDEIARGEYFECLNCFGDMGFSQLGKFSLLEFE